MHEFRRCIILQTLLFALISPLTLIAQESGQEAERKARFQKQLRLANTGDTYAMCSVGSMYRFGEGVEENGNEGLIWYRNAAEEGHSDAMHSLEIDSNLSKVSHFTFCSRRFSPLANQ